jgi:hypothetical protein
LIFIVCLDKTLATLVVKLRIRMCSVPSHHIALVSHFYN